MGGKVAGKGAGGKQSQLQLKLASVQHCGTWQTDDNDNNCNETEISSGHTGSTRHTDDDVARGASLYRVAGLHCRPLDLR